MIFLNHVMIFLNHAMILINHDVILILFGQKMTIPGTWDRKFRRHIFGSLLKKV